MLYKGNNKFKTLHKGNELVTRVFKGDELVYQDVDALYSWKFTIDTRKQQNGANTNTVKTFQIGFNNPQDNSNVPFTPVSVDWGDGNTDTITYSGGSASITHTYSDAGAYQIKLLPTVFDGAVPRTGWLSGIWLDSNYRYKVISIDKAFPEGAYNFSTQYSSRNTMTVRNTNVPFKFQNMRNLASVPANLFKNVTFIAPTSATLAYMSGMFEYLCQFCGANIAPANKDYNIMSVVKVFFDKLNTTGVTNMGNIFYYAFSETNSDTIPSGLFDAFDTSSVTNFSRAFSNTFYKVTQGNSTGTIPQGLLDNIDVSKATNVYQMFYWTFASAFGTELGAQGSTVATIPDRLLPLNFEKATSVNELFAYTFHAGFGCSPLAQIPEHIFDGLNIPLATDLTSLFEGTFSYINQATSLPEHLFDNVTLSPQVTKTNKMFRSTFYRCGYFYNVSPRPASTATIPSGLFDFLDMSSVTQCANMFEQTFEESFITSTAASIPAGLFDSIDMTNVSGTGCYTMFRRTFAYYGGASTVAVIPAGLFDHINTSSATNLSGFFSGTFTSYGQKSTVIEIPSDLFSHLDTSNALHLNQLFESTFYGIGGYSPNITIPAGLFSSLDFGVAKNMMSTFTETFSNFGGGNTSGTIPSGLFSTIAAPNAENYSSLFSKAFSEAFKSSTAATIPGDLFAYVDTTHNPTVNSMFYGTFSGYGQASLVTVLPSVLFPSNLDFSSTTNFNSMFRDTFQGAFNPSHRETVPANLFQNIDTSNATNTTYMFLSVFKGAAMETIPQGIFGNIKVAATHDRMFGEAFSTSYRTPASPRTILYDPFDGMTDFSWASASDTTNTSALWGMFKSNEYSPGSVSNVYTPILDGSASTVLQHFNFTPNVDLDVFLNQKFLTDYSTLPNNWK